MVHGPSNCPRCSRTRSRRPVFDNLQAGVLSGATKALVGLGLSPCWPLHPAARRLRAGRQGARRSRSLARRWQSRTADSWRRRTARPSILLRQRTHFRRRDADVGLFRMFEERGDRDYVIGSDTSAHFPVGNLLGMSRLPIVRSTGSDFEAPFTQQTSGDPTDGVVARPWPSWFRRVTAKPAADVPGAYVLPIGSDSRLMLRPVRTSFNIVGTPKAPPLPGAAAYRLGGSGIYRRRLALHALAISSCSRCHPIRRACRSTPS